MKSELINHLTMSDIRGLMKRLKYSFLFILIGFLLFLSVPQDTFAQQEVNTSDIDEFFFKAIQSGKLTAEQLQELSKAKEEGRLTPQVIKEYQQKAEMGTLTPAEIEVGEKLLEQKKEAPEKAEIEVEKEPEEEVAEPMKEEIEPTKEEVAVESEEEFFKKTDAPERPVLQIFGHKLFTGAPSTFTPIKTLPVSNDYVIGPGDEIKILMWGRLDATYSLEVDNEGIINLPKIGPLTVAGLTFGELKELIRRKAEAITGVNVSISMGRLRTIQVFVLGEVKAPGVYTVSSLATVANALLASGGPTNLGSLRRVQLKRKKKVIKYIDLYNFLLKGDTSSDTRLMPSDVIFIPQVGPMVSVSGNVKRPAIYELKSKKNLKTALKLAGGLTPRAYNQRIQIERAFENRFQVVLDIPYEELKQKKAISLQDGDFINVFFILPSPVNAVYLYGNVLRPGQYAYKPGLRVLDILPDPESLDIDTYFNYALVKRYRFEDSKAEIIPFDLGRLIFIKDETHNIKLMPLDEVYIFNKHMFEDREYATAVGQVRKPGRYFIDDMKIKDLILKAGDLADEAYLPKGELIRIDENRIQYTIYFDVSAALADDPKHNLHLQDEDRVIIHSIWEDQWKAFVTIQGEVKNEGEFVLTKDMNLKDLFFKAGSFSRNAYMELGHLYRTDWRTKEVTIHTFSVEKAMEGDPEHNLSLQDLDNVVVHNIREYVPAENVSISGEVQKPGTYPYGTNMCVKDLILVAQNITRDAYMELGHLYRTDWRTKELTIHTFNVEKAMEDDSEHNIFLQDLDNVVIHSIWEYKEKYTVSINGLVNNPGDYPFATNMTINDLILVAGNVRDAAYLDEAELTRFDIVEGKKVETSIIDFNIRLAQQGHLDHNLKLQPLDVVTIKAIPEWWDKKKTVLISGEVFFPGTFQIRKDESLSSVIERAGGYTEYAYMRGSVFTREMVRRTQQERINEMLKRVELEIARLSSAEAQAILSPEDVAAQNQFVAAQKMLLEKLKKTEATGRIIISLLPLKELKNSSHDMTLEDGDTLYIPKKPTTVYVLGAVYNPTALLYEEERPIIRYYLAKTGGPTENANTKYMYVIGVDGTVVSKRDKSLSSFSWNSEGKRWEFGKKFENTKLYPGDAVLVPEKIIKPRYMRDIRDITQILYQIAVTAGVTTALF